ncbi:amidohydrolase [Pontibacter diazotrophicus]|uniref:Amidohydrolase n=1 Tax=Pontibacter diazotrophicus TaxID=1400979 RepID=A0A3D8LHT0_9BACT|nr:amidohydrolase family protein [Pontibacter diazotrophicus]RDV16947.1 amidohydrolase [Pontibacter diazotrophicus]
MQKVDAHQHFWKFDPVRDSWITDDMASIRRDFGPEDLQPVLRQHGFDGCVAVQADQSEAENDFLLTYADRYDFIKGVVGWVDLRAENIQERLNHYAGFGKMKGFRHVLQGEPDRALMLQPEFKRGISQLSGYGFTYDILIFPDQLRYAKELVAAFPEQPFVVDHLAKPNISGQEIEAWARDMKAIAQYENVYCKLSGMVTEADWQHWKKEDFIPYLDVVVQAFGTNRIMYGSDWPVCLVAASYEEVLSIVEDYFSAFSQAEQAAFFGGNASRFYKLS